MYLNLILAVMFSTKCSICFKIDTFVHVPVLPISCIFRNNVFLSDGIGKPKMKLNQDKLSSFSLICKLKCCQLGKQINQH